MIWFGPILQVLTGLVDNMKHKVNGSLLADYGRFKNERRLHKLSTKAEF